ncbi:MAG TPA: NUDIX hydrolase [Candidatus Dormibacteraeota bacterium]|nr:NUDIX hydrolase [Candidatus Dormibacteraeota bacterium]
MVRTDHRGRSGLFELLEDVIRFADGSEALYTLITNPDSSFVVPYFDNGDTMLVRQWRHAWNVSSWEVPAGTSAPGEDPLACARRELAEETGLFATGYTSLGVVRGAAILTGAAHLYMAEGLTESARSPETYEQDMEVLRLPFVDALNAALDGQIVHSGSVTALCRAARALKLI